MLLFYDTILYFFREGGPIIESIINYKFAKTSVHNISEETYRFELLGDCFGHVFVVTS